MKPAIIRPDLELKKEIREVPARNVIYIRLFGDYKMNDYGGTWMRLFQFIKEEKLPMGDMAPYCMYHDDPKVTPADKLRTDVCMVMPVTVTPKGDVGFQAIACRTLCSVLPTKDLMSICKVYTTRFTESFIPEMECTMRDESSAERYLNDPCNTKPEDLLTEIFIPVE